MASFAGFEFGFFDRVGLQKAVELQWLAATGLKDARRGFGLDPSWPTFLPLLGIPIDHVAVSDEFLVTDHRKLPAFGSDHFPVIAELVLR